jgi:lipoprotein-releasing system permease protein
LTDNANLKKVKPAIEEIMGPEYLIKDRYEQEALLYKILKSEKFAIYFILSFILIIALFNLTGSISIMMIDKKEDITFLWNMGANQQLIRRIFYFEGMLISVSGAVLGMVTGFIISWVQQTFGLLKLGTSGSFVVSAYPVKMEVGDFFLVLGTVLALGFLATRYPVRQMIARYQLKKHH